jgi:hypothetical protein
MKNRRDVVSALVSNFWEDKSREDISHEEESSYLLNLAFSNDEQLISKLVDIVNDIDLPKSNKSQSGSKNGHYWFELLTSSQRKKFKANWNSERRMSNWVFEDYLDKEWDSIDSFLRSGFVYITSKEGLSFWLELENDLRNK